MSATILVVEDEPAIQTLVAACLQNAGHQVVRADTAEEAIRKVNEILPDVVLLDWMLPGMSGIQLARRLRGDERTHDLPIIMLTARGEEHDKIAGLDAGADDYLTKPFSPRELLARIKLAHALMMWDSASLARTELLERGQAGMPPGCAVACVWGRRDAVLAALDDIGVLRGDWASLDVAGEPIPGMLGPVPIAAPVTVSERELESMQDRVKALVRVPVGMRAQLAVRLRSAVARHMASRTPGELRFQIDPKDLI